MELRVCAAWGLTFQVGVHSWLEAFGFGGKDARLEPNQSLRTLNPRPQTLEPARSPGAWAAETTNGIQGLAMRRACSAVEG